MASLRLAWRVLESAKISGILKKGWSFVETEEKPTLFKKI